MQLRSNSSSIIIHRMNSSFIGFLLTKIDVKKSQFPLSEELLNERTLQTSKKRWCIYILNFLLSILLWKYLSCWCTFDIGKNIQSKIYNLRFNISENMGLIRKYRIWYAKPSLQEYASLEHHQSRKKKVQHLALHSSKSISSPGDAEGDLLGQ